MQGVWSATDRPTTPSTQTSNHPPQIYTLDAVFDTPDDVPESVKTNKRYANVAGYTISEVAEQVRDFVRMYVYVSEYVQIWIPDSHMCPNPTHHPIPNATTQPTNR